MEWRFSFRILFHLEHFPRFFLRRLVSPQGIEAVSRAVCFPSMTECFNFSGSPHHTNPPFLFSTNFAEMARPFFFFLSFFDGIFRSRRSEQSSILFPLPTTFLFFLFPALFFQSVFFASGVHPGFVFFSLKKAPFLFLWAKAFSTLLNHRFVYIDSVLSPPPGAAVFPFPLAFDHPPFLERVIALFPSEDSCNTGFGWCSCFFCKFAVSFSLFLLIRVVFFSFLDAKAHCRTPPASFDPRSRIPSFLQNSSLETFFFVIVGLVPPPPLVSSPLGKRIAPP